MVGKMSIFGGFIGYLVALFVYYSAKGIFTRRKWAKAKSIRPTAVEASTMPSSVAAPIPA
jgi:predicted transporter